MSEGEGDDPMLLAREAIEFLSGHVPERWRITLCDRLYFDEVVTIDPASHKDRVKEGSGE